MIARGIFGLIFAAAAAALLSLFVPGCSTGPGDEALSPGELTFRRSCQSCHSLPRPSMKTDEEWPSLVARYGTRAKLDEDQIAQITAYLIASN